MHTHTHTHTHTHKQKLAYLRILEDVVLALLPLELHTKALLVRARLDELHDLGV